MYYVNGICFYHKLYICLPVNNRILFAGEAVIVTPDIPAGVCGGVVDKLSGRSLG